MLNGDYSQLDKADIFALGATLYQLATGTDLPESAIPCFFITSLRSLQGNTLDWVQGRLHSLQVASPMRTSARAN